ncbi:MAG TPA: diol dehydratase small subunit [Candidatus Limnocylindrales bacterium]|nr:diol dehydratase small subunit [Candidatus Limnocylindrales bacterium]
MADGGRQDPTTRPPVLPTLETLAAGRLAPEDIRISGATLRGQAERAARVGYRPFASNLIRAAELVDVPDDEVLAIYEALRPHRSTATELEGAAHRLEALGATACAALVREAAEAYAARGMLRQIDAPSGRD